jgi:glyoxylase-like metal-dependent hydrolase (beta-lactamase superfamily II)
MHMNIVNVGYSSTNYYVIEEGNARLLIDVGMPGTYPHLLANLKRMDIPIESIRYLLVTHYHPDHAGIVEEVKAAGVRLIVMDPQVEAIDYMQKNYIKPDSGFIPIQLEDSLILTLAESRGFLKGIGLDGEIIATPGHSDDSVSLLLDSGSVFIGDLTFPNAADDESREIVLASWEKLRDRGAKQIYSGHHPHLAFD